MNDVILVELKILNFSEWSLLLFSSQFKFFALTRWLTSSSAFCLYYQLNLICRCQFLRRFMSMFSNWSRIRVHVMNWVAAFVNFDVFNIWFKLLTWWFFHIIWLQMLWCVEHLNSVWLIIYHSQSHKHSLVLTLLIQ